MDNISVMCRNSALCRFLARIVGLSKVPIFVFVVINGINMYKYMTKVVIKILQGSVVTQTM